MAHPWEEFIFLQVQRSATWVSKWYHSLDFIISIFLNYHFYLDWTPLALSIAYMIYITCTLSLTGRVLKALSCPMKQAHNECYTNAAKHLYVGLCNYISTAPVMLTIALMGFCGEELPLKYSVKGNMQIQSVNVRAQSCGRNFLSSEIPKKNHGL